MAAATAVAATADQVSYSSGSPRSLLPHQSPATSQDQPDGYQYSLEGNWIILDGGQRDSAISTAVRWSPPAQHRHASQPLGATSSTASSRSSFAHIEHEADVEAKPEPESRWSSSTSGSQTTRNDAASTQRRRSLSPSDLQHRRRSHTTTESASQDGHLEESVAEAGTPSTPSILTADDQRQDEQRRIPETQQAAAASGSQSSLATSPSPSTRPHTISPFATTEPSTSASSLSSKSMLLLTPAPSEAVQSPYSRASAARAQVQERARRLRQQSLQSAQAHISSPGDFDDSHSIDRSAAASMREMEEILSGPWLSDSSDEEHQPRRRTASSSAIPSSSDSRGYGTSRPASPTSKLRNRVFFMEGIALGGSHAMQRSEKRANNGYPGRHLRWASSSSIDSTSLSAANLSQTSLNSSPQAITSHGQSTAGQSASPLTTPSLKTDSATRSDFFTSPPQATIIPSSSTDTPRPPPNHERALPFPQRGRSVSSPWLRRANSHLTLSDVDEGGATNGTQNGSGGTGLQAFAAGVTKKLRRWKKNIEGKDTAKGRLGLGRWSLDTNNNRPRAAAAAAAAAPPPLVRTEQLTTIEVASPTLPPARHGIFESHPLANRSLPSLFVTTTQVEVGRPAPALPSPSPLRRRGTHDTKLEEGSPSRWARRRTLRKE